MPASLIARAFWVTGPGQGEIRSEALPEPKEADVLVRALTSGVSRGTESLVFQGRVPPSQWQTMRCPFQDGGFPDPVKYGYASVGVVESGPDSLLGRRVFVLYPHQDRYVVPVASAIPVPTSVPTSRAVLAANLETAINALWDGGPRIGDRIAVIGAGVVGALVATLVARIPGTRVELIDTDPSRAALAARLGIGFATPEMAAEDADVVFHASGNPAGLILGLRLAGFEARIVELSWYGDSPVTLPLGEGFHSRRLTLRSSQVGQVAESRRARWSPRRRLALALDLLADRVFDALLDGESAFEDLPTTMARLALSPGALCHRILYPE
jgi:2-desacetyl-2-hydroxyethyl bacteriochlorophyllide A dehydrogenase